jgi:hypothetical protein
LKKSDVIDLALSLSVLFTRGADAILKNHTMECTVYGRIAVVHIFRSLFSPAHLLQYEPITEESSKTTKFSAIKETKSTRRALE